MEYHCQDVLRWLQTKQQSMLSQLHQFCEINSSSNNLPGLLRMQQALEVAFSSVGDPMEIQPSLPFRAINMAGEVNEQPCGNTLFLDEPFRKQANGLILSRARLLFMANHPERFSASVIAEIRGVSDESGHSRFWDSLSQHFFNMTFQEADHLSAINHQLIAELMPTYPIYVVLLPASAQQVIGKPHPATAKALHILQCYTALDELTQLLELGSMYPFQKNYVEK